MKTLVFGLIFASSSAFAVANQNLSFEQLKLACKEPGRFQNQNKPSEIKISCSDRVFKWVPAGSGTMTLPSKRTVYFKVSSDKYTVPGNQTDVAADSFQGECPVLKQVEEVTSLSKDVSCEQVEDYTGTAAELCISLIDQLRAENTASVEVRETGRTTSFCRADGSAGNGGNGGHKPLK